MEAINNRHPEPRFLTVPDHPIAGLPRHFIFRWMAASIGQKSTTALFIYFRK